MRGGPHPKTRALIAQIRSALADKGTMTFDELYKHLKVVSRPRLRMALNWAQRQDVRDVGDRRYRLVNLFDQEKARSIEDVRSELL